jgi:uncharacterized protein with HEPN domain
MRQSIYEQKLQGLYQSNQIIEAVSEIEEFTSNITFEQFLQNKMAIKAVSMNLLLIGENKTNSYRYKAEIQTNSLAKNEICEKLFSP